MKRIPRIQGAQECTLEAEAELATTTVRQPWSRPPIDLDFSGKSLPFSQVGVAVADRLSGDVYGFGIARTILEGI
jgi:hypothetical protein